MEGFLNLMSENPVYVLLVLLALAIAFKEVYEFVQWFRGILNTWYENRSKRENKDKDLRGKIEKLEVYVKDDKAQIRGLELHLSEIDEANKQQNIMLENLSNTVRDMRLETMRAKILDAVPKCIDLTSSNIGSEDYTNLFQIYTTYEEILSEHGLENSQVSLAMKMIKESYRKRLAAELLTDYRYLPPEEIRKKIRKADDAISWWTEKEEDDEGQEEKEK